MSINLMRNKWASDWDSKKAELAENHKKVNKIVQEH